MGQSSSTAVASSEPNPYKISDGKRCNFHSWLANGEEGSDTDAEHVENSTGGRDYTADLPDDCLAGIFHFLGSADLKKCSLVCRRWLRVDGQSRHRLSLDAHEELQDFVPSLFDRFNFVTKLSLRCDRRSASISDDVLILISLRCKNLKRLKLHGCREISEIGMAGLTQNCKALKKLSCGSCMFGTKGMNTVIDHCVALEELSVKRLRGVHDSSAVIGPGAAASSLKSICLKDIVNGQSFAPLIVGSKKLRRLKLISCLGDWDSTLEAVGDSNRDLIEVHLEKIQVSDVGLSGISNCLNLETLLIVKNPECSNLGLSCVAERCRLLRKLHIDGWRTNNIGDEGLIAIAKHCPNLQELVLICIYPATLSLTAIASNCKNLERLALCGIGSIGDAEMESIAAKCSALKKLCIKGCPITNAGIEALALGCPNLVKIKVKKCKKVTGGIVEWLRERRGSLAFSFDDIEPKTLEGNVSGGGAQESEIASPSMIREETVADEASSSGDNNRLTMLRTNFGFLAGRNIVPVALRRWINADNVSDGSFS